jgi:predicted dehydrogenase
MTSNGKFAFALVGCGGVGRKRAAACLQGAGILTQVHDACSESVIDFAQDYGCRGEFVAGEYGKDVDAVIVATPNAHLYPIAMAAAEAGKHVLVEKPGAISSAQLMALLGEAKKRSLHVHVGYNHRYHPAISKACQMVGEGAIGPLMHIRARYGHGGRLGYEKEWRADPKLSGGGELMDQGVHLIDLAQWFMGEFYWAEGQVITSFWKMPVEDNAFISLHRDNQVAWLHASCTEWKNLFSFEVFGQTGKLQIDGLGGSYGTERLTYYRMLPEMGPPETTIWEYPQPDNSWKLELEDFVKQATTRPNQDSLVDAIRTLEVVEKIYGHV